MNAAERLVLCVALAFLIFALLLSFGPDYLAWRRNRKRFWSDETIAEHEARWERRPKPGPGKTNN